MKSDLSILIVNYNTRHLLPKFFASVYSAVSEINAQIIVVDNASTDDSLDYLRSNSTQYLLIENHDNVGFGRAVNQAVEYSNGSFVLLLNTDLFLEGDALVKVLKHMKENINCGILGIRLVNRDEQLEPCCRYFPNPVNMFLSRTGLQYVFTWVVMVDNFNWDHKTVRKCDWVPGCFYLIRAELSEQTELFDSRYFMYYEEVDHCLSAKRAGWEVHFYPYTQAIHLGGESAKSEGEVTDTGSQLPDLATESELLFFRKNHGILGLTLHMILRTLGDLIILAKLLVRYKSFKQISRLTVQSGNYWKCLYRTKFGNEPTR